MSHSKQPNGFGTFSGVFVPNLLTILGVIMFMRTGWVVGQAGLHQALLILLTANSITLLSALSMSAIATNTRVEGGGAYFLISRSLGLEIGSSIGVPFYLAQTVSVAFYLVGFTESIAPFVGDIDLRWISIAILGIIFLISWISSDLAIKAQNIILIVLLSAIVSFFFGWNPIEKDVAIEAHYSEGFHFWSVFAIFFPAVTGIMAGASMSGDLKNPSKSIPKGTLWAVGITFFVYACQMFWFSRNASRTDLIENNMIMRDVAAFGPLIYAGLWAATLSSALASLLGAPRTLQALAKDGVGPKFIARASGKKKEPRIALIISTILASVCLMAGDLDLIAPIISMFFLATYAAINFVAGIESWSGNPSYRPKFRVHWFFSFLGAIACLAVMFLLNAFATVVAISLMVLVYFYLASRRYETAWGDTWSGFWFNLTRTALIKFGRSRKHIRNWRPVILVLSGNPNTRADLVSFANFFESKKGFIFLAEILIGEWSELRQKRDSSKEAMNEFIQQSRLTGESRVVVANNFESGVSTLIQSTGVGPLVPNTVLLGWSGDLLNHQIYLNTLRRILELQMNVVVHSNRKSETEELEKVIDVWWGAKVNGSVMLVFAHLLGANREWREYKKRVLLIVSDTSEIEKAKQELDEVIEDSRINASVSIVTNEGSPLKTIQHNSHRSEVVLVGFNLEALVSNEKVFRAEKDFLKDMDGNVFLVKNWQELEL